VYLVPFTPLGGDNSMDWAGKAVAQNLMTDLARARFVVVASEKTSASSSETRAAAVAAGARYTLTGTYQLADTLVRFNAQLIDNATGNVVGGLSATGAPRDLFNLEDSLSAQAIAQLTHPRLAANNQKANAAPGPVPPALQPAAVAQIIQPLAVAQTGSTSSYDGSALQQYVDANRTPSNDYSQQVQNAADRSTYGYGYSSYYPLYLGSYSYGLGYGAIGYGGIGYGGLGYSLFYGFPSGGHHHGR
jgi:TolB-like protein